MVTRVGMVSDGMRLYHEFQDSQESGKYDNTYREGVRIGGGWGGAWATGMLAAKAGAIICAPLTPYGQAGCAF